MIKSYERLKKLNKEKLRIPRTVQDTIPVDTIYKDGIFKSGNKYTKSYRFLDINYKIASGEDKNNLFLSYSDLLNSFDSSVMTKITINNRKVDIKKFKEDILIPLKQDNLDPYREEYNNMLLDKLSESDDIVQEKYITVTIFKNSIEEARFTFSRITTEFSTLFARLGSSCIELNAEERLKILHDFYRNETEEFSLDNDVRVSTLSRYPEVFTMEECSEDEDELWNGLKEALEGAFSQFVEMRTKEGERLKEDILLKLDLLSEQIRFIEERSPQIIAEYRTKLEEKMRELLEDTQIDDNRIAAEVILFADKICTDEEVVRLKSHIQHMKETLEESNGIGRKLDFIAQEMNREANTILSKANDLDISNRAISLKTEIEKIREQIQNIE